MSLLTIVQAVAPRCGLPAPTSVIGSLDTTAQQLLEVVNEVGFELAERYNWEVLTKEATFTTVATESQGALTTIASDFDRFVNNTMFDRSATERVFGPLNEADWQRDQALNVTPVDTTFRVRGGAIIFNPVPAAGNTIAFEYISNQWVASKTEFTADADTTLLDERLLILGSIANFLESKGLSYAEQKRRFELRLANLTARDGSKPILNIGDGVSPFERSNGAVSLGNWGNLANNWEEIG